MRTRDEIEKAERTTIKYSGAPREELILEVLLDIRDLLVNPPIEISGSPMKITPL